MEQSLFLFPVVHEEMITIIRGKLRAKKSAGNDNVPSFLLKRVADAIVYPMTYIVNLSFKTGDFPRKLKINKVIPVHKKGDEQLMENYRPVALTSCFSKIFEYCFLVRLEAFLERFKILKDNQFGFRQHRSTADAIQSFVDRAVEHLENGECPAGIFCDLSRAFDCVNHKRLLEKLERYGVRGMGLRWVSSFLENRQQCVCVDNSQNFAQSEMLNIEVGVPQGTVLAPVLFIIYINDMDSRLGFECATALFADDTSLILSDRDSSSLERVCNENLANLSHWFSENFLYLNSEKTNFIRFHNYQNYGNMHLNLNINDAVIGQCEKTKFLGLTIDKHLNWKTHCSDIVAKLNSVSYCIRSLRRVLPEENLVGLYHAQAGSRLHYGVRFWGSSVGVKDVLVAQKRVVRAIMGLGPMVSCRTVFKRLNILTVVSVFIYEMCVYVYSNESQFTKNKHVHSNFTRSGPLFRVPFRKFNVGKNSPNVLGLSLFNRLPEGVKSTAPLRVFKKNLKLFLLEMTPYSLQEFFEAAKQRNYSNM